MKTLSGEISRYAFSLKYRDLSAEIVHEAKRRVIDSLGCAFGAYFSKPAQIAIKLGQKVSSRPGATILGTSHKSSIDMAAFANGTMVRYLDYNDSYFSKEPCHPSDNIAVALAVGEGAEASGKDIITAIILGTEVICRLCDAASMREHGWDHATYAAFSGSVVAAKLLGLSAQKIQHALAIAGVSNVALRQTRIGELSMWKGCSSPNAARNGIFAALLAKDGMTGPEQVFEGEKGFWKQVSGPFRLSRMGDGRVPFKIMDTHIKFYPVDYYAQSAIEAALELNEQLGSTDTVKAVEIETFKDAFEIIAREKEKLRPTTRETADHSLAYCVSVGLMDGRVGADQFTEKRIRDPKLRRLLRRISIKENPEFTRDFPASTTNLVRVITNDGRILEKKVKYPKGHAKNRLTDQQIEEKFYALAAPFLFRSGIKDTLQTLWRLEKIADIGKVMQLFSLQ